MQGSLIYGIAWYGSYYLQTAGNHSVNGVATSSTNSNDLDLSITTCGAETRCSDPISWTRDKAECLVPTGPKPLFPEYDRDTGMHRWRLCCRDTAYCGSCDLRTMQELRKLGLEWQCGMGCVPN